MGRALHIAVIADDITGAADTGVQFCPAIGPVHMTGAPEGRCLAAADMPADGIAVFTNTRHADPAAAAEVVRCAAGSLRELNPALIYKKIDSCLRGNLGAEIDALLEATGRPASFVAPALPQQGRTTVNDRHLVNGVPVADTEIGRDPRCPVTESRLSVLLAAQSRLPVGRIGLDCLEKGLGETVRRVRALLDQGCRHIAFDAQHTEHLDAIAGLARRDFGDMLLVGSAGLAASLSRLMLPVLAGPSALRRPRVIKWLFVCGSGSPVLGEQVAELARSTGWNHLVMAPSDLIAADGSDSGAIPTALPAGHSTDAGVILSIQPIRGTGPVREPGRVVAGLAAAAVSLMDTLAPQGVFLSGGDTAEAFWRAIGAHGLRIREEILPGLVLGDFIGGPHHGLPVVTKAGAFGHTETLLQLIRCLK